MLFTVSDSRHSWNSDVFTERVRNKSTEKKSGGPSGLMVRVSEGLGFESQLDPGFFSVDLFSLDLSVKTTY